MVVEILIPSKITVDLAYLCGVFAGDGSMNFRASKFEYSLKCVGNPKDEKEFYRSVLSPLMKRVFGVTLKLKYHDKRTTYGFTVYSKNLVKYLVSLGLPLGKKFDSLQIHKCCSVNSLSIPFVRGLFDTDGCISFKKRYRNYPYYPVISFSSKSSSFTKEVVSILKHLDFRVVELYDYILYDKRIAKGFTKISKIELNGQSNLDLWMKLIGFSNPKHLEKIKRYGKE